MDASDVIQHPSEIDYWVSLLEEKCEGEDELDGFYTGSDDGLYFVMDAECQMVCLAPKAVAEWLVKLINEHHKRVKEGDT